MRFSFLKSVIAALLAWFMAGAVQAQTPAPAPRLEPYAPYAFLIGEWDAGPPGAPPMFIERFRWGPNRSYIWFSTSLLSPRGEHLHFEGMLVWNGRHKGLDMLLVLEPGSFGQEAGVLTIAPDGTVTRDITATQADGATAHFRQTFRPAANDTVTTALMRETATGWAPNFPGSDNLVMRRRAASASSPPGNIPDPPASRG